IERNHEGRFMTLLAKLSRTPPEQAPAREAAQDAPAPRRKKTGYRCQFCGAVFEERPDVCDTCQAIGAFELVDYYE
ncbi:MAG: rubrerythrin, partial [Lawsonibacter sp.]|nr:rubrerythrin [Lawsonibacter sp.]